MHLTQSRHAVRVDQQEQKLSVTTTVGGDSLVFETVEKQKFSNAEQFGDVDRFVGWLDANEGDPSDRSQGQRFRPPCVLVKRNCVLT